jgi:hypothetical protein
VQVTTHSRPDANGAGRRKSLSPAALAALWAVSNGHCYAPGCTMPVVLEVRPGVYQKNSQVAHIYGIRPGTPRYRPDMPNRERDSFANLLLLCIAHHEEVDGKNGEDLYPPETLRGWKARHEGAAGSVLKNLTVPSTDALMKKLTEIAEPPLERLEAITARLEETGTATEQTVADLRQVISMLSMTIPGADARTAARLSYAAEVLGTETLRKAARQLAHAADVLPGTVSQLERAAGQVSQLR